MVDRRASHRAHANCDGCVRALVDGGADMVGFRRAVVHFALHHEWQRVLVAEIRQAGSGTHVLMVLGV